jgi:hypothetical protein
VSTNKDGHPADISQAERFKQLARQLEADEDEGRWDERLKKVVEHKPVDEKPE